ncbi:hypothetical protein [Paraburkholderia sp. SIMBA_054]|uniref:hypothetical protein n=1 Tax=Paraburkholderia sp. SIMBA_054 TaxID=3085795 RepID=UPI0039795E10
MTQQTNTQLQLKTTAPPAVEQHVAIFVHKLRDHERALDGVQRARGNGYILALEVRDRIENIAHCKAQLEEFRGLAKSNGVDANAVISRLGGEPDFVRFGAPATH